MMQGFKRWLQQSSLAGPAYAGLRDAWHRMRKLALFARDARLAWRDLRWRGAAAAQYWVLSAELLFQFHKLEKGLCMPGTRRFFGHDPASATLDLLARWRAAGLTTDQPVYQGALATLRAYRQRLDLTPPAQGQRLLKRLDEELARAGAEPDHRGTPLQVAALRQACAVDATALESLLKARRSVRSFSPAAVPPEAIRRAVELAQWAPSACNRQPWRVHVYAGREQIDALLALQDGNRGFGHTIPVLLILAADSRGFFDASERDQPFVDGGLFAMALTLALQSMGLSSCCLNWCVEAGPDDAAHRLGGLHPAERIVMFMAVGHAADDALTPRSPRRPAADVLTFHP